MAVIEALQLKTETERNHVRVTFDTLQSLDTSELIQVRYIDDICGIYQLCQLPPKKIQEISKFIHQQRLQEEQKTLNVWAAWFGAITALTALAGLCLSVYNLRRTTRGSEVDDTPAT